MKGKIIKFQNNWIVSIWKENAIDELLPLHPHDIWDIEHGNLKIENDSLVGDFEEKEILIQKGITDDLDKFGHYAKLTKTI